MACFRCKHGGGWTPGSISWTQCEQTKYGEREGCVVEDNQCVFSGGGCISLPKDPGTIHGALIQRLCAAVPRFRWSSWH